MPQPGWRQNHGLDADQTRCQPAEQHHAQRNAMHNIRPFSANDSCHAGHAAQDLQGAEASAFAFERDHPGAFGRNRFGVPTHARCNHNLEAHPTRSPGHWQKMAAKKPILGDEK
jgi:hypothetical protein